ncbi:MAG: hypothetical protein JO332_05355, partial [Planctomycetaceae bacterium]|nr:hypothetical protein [Planctomycetaceae bacterium]
MGNEIVYCSSCRTRLLAGDFDHSKAVWHADRPYCAACIMGLVSSLAPEEEQRILEKLAVKRSADPDPEAPRRAPVRKTSTSRIPVVKTERRTAVPAPAVSGVLIALGVGVLILIAVAVAAVSERPAPTAKASEAPRPVPVPIDVPRPEAPVSRSAAEESVNVGLARREEAARKSLEKARAYGKTNAADLPGRIALLEEAAWECRGTLLAAEARREHETLQRQRGDLVFGELLRAAEKPLAAAAAGRYGEAVALLRKEECRLDGADWKSAIDQKILQIRQSADRAYAALREEALQARRRGAEDDVRVAVDRVSAWGLEDLSTDLAAALAALPPPAKPVPLEVRAYLGAWEAAFALARDRDYPSAVRSLETAAAALQDPIAKVEAAVDVDALRGLAAAHADILQALAHWPKGQKISLQFDGGGAPVRAEGTVTKAGPGGIEIKTESDLVSIDLDDLTGGCLRALLGKIAGRKPEADARIAVLFPLLDGEAAEAGPGVSPRIVAYGARIAEERARPETVTREADARSRFESAERDYDDPATKLASFDRYRSLLESSGDSAFLRRKRPLIAQRLQGEKDAGREYVFFPDQMRPAGAFQRGNSAKVAACWTSTLDVPPEKENFVEFTFSARPTTEYRCWVYVGGCCAETFAFDLQGTETGAEPGAPQRLPVKNGLLFLKKTHAAHGGRKEPSRFEWISVPLPKYAGGGPKTLRLLSGQQGFSVALAVVSATRMAPPADPQVKEWERGRASAPPTSAAESGLAGWWTLDEGSGATAGDSSPNRISGALRNDPVWTSGRRRGALSFDGQNDYIEIAKTPKL